MFFTRASVPLVELNRLRRHMALCLQAGHGVGPGAFTRPVVDVVRRLNRDTSLSARFFVEDGRKLSALEIQQAFLESVSRHIHALPPWAPAALEHWRSILEALNSGVPCECKKLDWAIFLQALKTLASEYGYTAEEVRRLNASYAQLKDKPSERVRAQFLDFRAAANELYIRLHVLGGESLFDLLERQGLVEHRMSEISAEAIESAISEPPRGRAANRSALIGKYRGLGGFSVSWDKLVDSGLRSLTIPETATLNEGENWQATADQSSQSRLSAAGALFRVGRYHETINAIGGIDLAEFGAGAWDAAELLYLSYARLGMRPETMQARQNVARLSQYRFHEIAISMSAVNNLGLSPPLDEMVPLIQSGESALADADGNDYFIFAFNLYKARVLGLQGKLEQAEWMLRSILTLPANQSRTRMMARTRCFHAEVLRLLGRTEEAIQALGRARERLDIENLVGDLADHSLPTRAKLVNDEQAVECLKQAESIQRQLGNEIGLARVLCLKARRLRTAADYSEICNLQHRVTALQDCRLAAKVVTEWGSWVRGCDGEGPADYRGIRMLLAPSKPSKLEPAGTQPFRPMPSHKLEKIKMRMSASRLGRAFLHISTFLRSRRNFRWHLRCILRELRGSKPDPRKR